MVRGWAIARLGLSREEFYLMRPGEFWEAMQAWQADKEADRRHVAEVVRGVGIRLFNIQLKKGDQIKDPRKFMRFPWDDDPDAPDQETQALLSMSTEERDALARDFMDRIKL